MRQIQAVSNVLFKCETSVDVVLVGHTAVCGVVAEGEGVSQGVLEE